MSAPMRRLSILLAVLILAGCASGAVDREPPELFGRGGDAWTFTQEIHGAISTAGACAELRVESPAGAVVATRAGTRFSARVPLGAGENRLVAVCRTPEGQELRSRPQKWRLRLVDRPKARARVHVKEGRLELDASGSEPGEGRPVPIVGWRWSEAPGNPAPMEISGAAGSRAWAEVPPIDGEYYVRLRVTDAAGRQDWAGAAFRVEAGKARPVDVAREHPAWVDRAVVYGVTPHFFDPPGFAGVRARLDELADLGIDVLWLSPITEAPDDDFGYAVIDPFRPRAQFGGEKELRALIRAAHARGMRVVMDFVPNHVSDRHAYYRAGACDPASPYHDWFERDAAGEVEHYFDWSNLPNLDYDQPEVRRYVMEAFLYWVRELDVDGFRVDVAWGVARRAPDFWPDWRRELKRVKPDLLLLAEAGARDRSWAERGFDAAYDWTEELGRWAWREAFERPEETATLLGRALAETAPISGREALVYRFLNNNDTGPRFVTRYGPKLTRVAAALLLSAPGIPGLYTGDEVGAEFEPYDEGPPLEWRDRFELRPWYRKLIELRHALPPLYGRRITLLQATPAPVLAYVRYADHGEGMALVLLNFSGQAVRAELPANDLEEMIGPVLRDHVSNEAVQLERAGGPVRVAMPPYGVRILTQP